MEAAGGSEPHPPVQEQALKPEGAVETLKG